MACLSAFPPERSIPRRWCFLSGYRRSRNAGMHYQRSPTHPAPGPTARRAEGQVHSYTWLVARLPFSSCCFFFIFRTESFLSSSAPCGAETPPAPPPRDPASRRLEGAGGSFLKKRRRSRKEVRSSPSAVPAVGTRSAGPGGG